MASKGTPKPTGAGTGTASPTSLREKLAAVLPQGYKFGIHHLSTPPSQTEALCSPPPNERPDKTYGESHFLAVSIDAQSRNDAATVSLKRASPGADETKPVDSARQQVLVFAIEVFIFTTAFQTIFFVSKADSTGYLHLLGLPKGAPSPIRTVCAAFVEYLIQHRRRANTQCLVNLFARAQAQYLFPGSVDNKGKHVLDDRGLVKWWCRVLNPLLENTNHSTEAWGNVRGYLMVPGLEEMEMRPFIPRTAASAKNWTIGHPLEKISHYTNEFDWVPPRCLIPRYPDDPKSRFRDELDEEISRKKNDKYSWASVKSLDEFWEMMAFRSECSSGRLTGFIWLVFDPAKPPGDPKGEKPEAEAVPQPKSPPRASQSSLPPSTPPRRRADRPAFTPQKSPLKALALDTSSHPPPANGKPAASVVDKKTDTKRKKRKQTGFLRVRAPRVKTQASNYLPKQPTRTAYYWWPVEGRGDRIVNESDYKRIIELLLHLDFETLDKASASTRRWLTQAGIASTLENEAQITGKAVVRVDDVASNGGPGQVTNLTSLVRKKNAPRPGSEGTTGTAEAPVTINVLGAGLIRKKKLEEAA